MNRETVQRQFDDRYMPVPEAGCWLWVDHRQPAWRTSWFLQHGVKPAGRRAGRSCGNDGCVNPAHLIIDSV